MHVCLSLFLKHSPCCTSNSAALGKEAGLNCQVLKIRVTGVGRDLANRSAASGQPAKTGFLILQTFAFLMSSQVILILLVPDLLWEPLPWAGQRGEARKPSLEALKIQAVWWPWTPSWKSHGLHVSASADGMGQWGPLCLM